MKGTSRVGSVNRDRVQRILVDRKTVVNQVSRVGAVTPVTPVNNESTSVNENFLLFAGAFYDGLTQLREHSHKFYYHQQALESFYHALSQQGEEESDQELIALMEALVEKYNHALEALLQLEERLHHHAASEGLRQLLTTYHQELNNIGLTFEHNLRLQFHPAVLIPRLKEDPQCLFFLLDFEHGLVRKLFNFFRNIKANTQKEAQGYQEAELPLPSGLLLDQRT